MTRRVVSLWLPHWPLERRRQTLLRRGAVGRAEALAEPREFALVETGAHGITLAAINDGARAVGLRVGQPLADARVCCPTLASEPIDRAADAAALEALARWLERYAPIVGLDGRDGLLLDVTGCAHLWGGEGPMLADMTRRLRSMGFTVQAALADTVGAAWGVARYSPEMKPDGVIVPPGAARLALGNLPPAALRLSEETTKVLHLLGLRQIGLMAQVPRAALARRFRAKDMAAAVVARLDQALGERGEPVVPLAPPPAHRVARSFGEPLIDRSLVAAWLPRLLDEFVTLLREQGLGVRRLRLTATRIDGTSQEMVIGMGEPTRDAAHMARLLAPRLDALEVGFGIDGLAVSAQEMTPLSGEQVGLGGDRGALGLTQLGDRLANRLGDGSVYRLAGYESHVPERAERMRPRARPEAAVDLDRPRPLLLLDRPEAVSVIAEVPEGPPARFVWRRLEHRVTRAIGPERIAPEWWEAHEGERTRDYYVVEDVEGRRFWLFRHGLYDAAPGEAEAVPDWYIHGLFA